MGVWIVLGVLVVIVILLIGMYNSLVQLRVRADNAWSDIDVQLKRRHDLIPNLVETVRDMRPTRRAHSKILPSFALWQCRQLLLRIRLRLRTSCRER